MNLALIFHIFLATLAFGMAIAFELVLVAVTRTQRVEAIKTAYEAANRYRPIIGISLLLAVALGFYMAVTDGYSLTAGWLLTTYGLLIVMGLVFGAFIQRRARRVLSLVASSNGTMTDELTKAAAGATPLAAIILLVIMFLIIGAMVR